jgi:tetratricopeptide (TPR) repeat protein
MSSLIKLFYNPAQAMSEIAGRAPYITSALLALAASLLYSASLSREVRDLLFASPASARGPNLFEQFNLLSQITSSIAPVLFLGAVFVPACLLAANLIERRSSFRLLLRQQYTSLASCIFYGWAAAHLIMLIPAWLVFDTAGPAVARDVAALRMTVLRLVPLPYFIFLVMIGVRAALRLSYGRACGAVVISSLSLLALPLLPSVLFLLTSPFLLILVIFLLRGFLGDAMSAARSREEFKQNLEAATLNPADGSAHYNLGLIYQQRGQLEDAQRSFRRAIEIDREDADSHYQLGRIAREEGRLAEAIGHFDEVVRRSPEHSQNEVWREIGQTYLQAGQLEDARRAFESFLERRPSDAECLYHYGLVLQHLGLAEQAAAQMRACIEAVRTSPAYKYRTEKRWMNQAEAFLRPQNKGQESGVSGQGSGVK